MKDILGEELKIGDLVVIISAVKYTTITHGIVVSDKGSVWNGYDVTKYDRVYRVASVKSAKEQEIYNSLNNDIENGYQQYKEKLNEKRNIMKRIALEFKNNYSVGDILLGSDNKKYIYLGQCDCSIQSDIITENNKGHCYLCCEEYVYYHFRNDVLTYEVMLEIIGWEFNSCKNEKDFLNRFHRVFLVTKEKSEKMLKKVGCISNDVLSHFYNIGSTRYCYIPDKGDIRFTVKCVPNENV